MMEATILLDEFVNAQDLNLFMDSYDWELLDRKYNGGETLLVCAPINSSGRQYSADDLAYEMTTWLDVGARVIDVEY